MSVLTLIAIISYFSATILLWCRFSQQFPNHAQLKAVTTSVATIALALHGHLLYVGIFTGNGLDFGFFNAVSLIAWLVCLIVMITGLFRPLENLLLILFPMAMVAMLAEVYLPGHRILSSTTGFGLRIHIILSICAYSLLMIAALQAVLLSLQERMIKQKRAVRIMNILPPLQVMENLLVQFIVIGFFLLSLSLASGMMFISDMFAQHLVHKTILAIIAWLIYAILLIGRWAAGWRGKTIIRWALGGFIALLLAYLGSKFVLELVLQRV